MISRSTILALVFACLATLSMAGVAEVRQSRSAKDTAYEAMPVYELPRVVVSGRINSTSTGN